MRKGAAILVLITACSPAQTHVVAPTSTVAVPVMEPSTPPASRTAELRVACNQVGVVLTVDGDPQPLPARLQLDPGQHVVRLAGDRYATQQRSITVAPGDVMDLGDMKLPVARGMVTISLLTPGARVLLVNGSDERELPMMPISVDFDAGKKWELRATLSGYCELVQPIDFSDGVAKKTIAVNLTPGCGP
jgi:hypothetical protein